MAAILRRPLFWVVCCAALLAAEAVRAQDCRTDKLPLNPAVAITLDPATAWQPRGGEIRIIVHSDTQSLKGMVPTVCYRWSRNDIDDQAPYGNPVPVRVVSFTSNDTSGDAVYAAAVPDLRRLKSSWPGRVMGGLRDRPPTDVATDGAAKFESMELVPLADVRICLTDGGTPAEAVVHVGITSIWNARAIATIAVLGAMGVLYLMAWRSNVPGRWPPMRLISTRNGYASLSQFQIMLWSFVIGAGAVYVMGLSGSLLDIPSGALVLLGITGATTIGSKIQSANADKKSGTPANAAPPPVAGPPGAPANLAQTYRTHDSVSLAWAAPAGANPAASYTVEYCLTGTAAWRAASTVVAGTSYRVTGLQPNTPYDFQVFAANAAGIGPASAPPLTVATSAAPARPREPQWSDLVISPDQPGEIDVTRVQMLFFTLITAGFVAIKLFNSYLFPDIPEGFMLLMGISNGAYLTAKFVPG
jgi:hypothetical protein